MYDTIPKADQADMMHVFWRLLRSQEEEADYSKNVLDRVMVEGGYRLWNRITGENKFPRWEENDKLNT